MEVFQYAFARKRNNVTFCVQIETYQDTTEDGALILTHDFIDKFELLLDDEKSFALAKEEEP